jgi:hypothetical protein
MYDVNPNAYVNFTWVQCLLCKWVAYIPDSSLEFWMEKHKQELHANVPEPNTSMVVQNETNIS